MENNSPPTTPRSAKKPSLSREGVTIGAPNNKTGEFITFVHGKTDRHPLAPGPMLVVTTETLPLQIEADALVRRVVGFSVPKGTTFKDVVECYTADCVEAIAAGSDPPRNLRTKNGTIFAYWWFGWLSVDF